MLLGRPIPGETPIDDISGLKAKGISLRKELNEVEAKNILKATVKYLGGRLSAHRAGCETASSGCPDSSLQQRERSMVPAPGQHLAETPQVPSYPLAGRGGGGRGEPDPKRVPGCHPSSGRREL